MISFIIKVFTPGQLLFLIIITEVILYALFSKLFELIAVCSTHRNIRKLANSGTTRQDEAVKIISNINNEKIGGKHDCKE